MYRQYILKLYFSLVENRKKKSKHNLNTTFHMQMSELRFKMASICYVVELCSIVLLLYLCSITISQHDENLSLMGKIQIIINYDEIIVSWEK